MKTYPIYQPFLKGNEAKYVEDCVKSSWISSRGKYVDKFEESFAKYIGIDYACTVANGTVALHTALLALGIQAGDEVIVPTLTYIASVNAIHYVGATPVFVDSRIDTWQMDEAKIREKITKNTKALLVVHLYGYPCDMEKIMAIAKEFNLYVVEDCAEAFGSKFKNTMVGTFGQIATFSFFGNKTITTGEGGMIVTNNKELHEKCFLLKTQGVSKTVEYQHDIVGYNYRMTNICAAIGCAQLENANAIIEKKREIAYWYLKSLGYMGFSFQEECDEIFDTWWLVSLVCKERQERDALRKYLKSLGIETRPVFPPIHTMPMYNAGEYFGVAEYISYRGFSLPSYPDLAKEDVDYICSKIKDFLQ